MLNYDEKSLSEIATLLRFCMQAKVSGYCANLHLDYLMRRYPWQALMFYRMFQGSKYQLDKAEKILNDKLNDVKKFISLAPLKDVIRILFK